MKFNILGCSGSALPGYRLTSFLINDTLLIDAGSVTSSLGIEEQSRITDILVTHAHLDHIKDILFLADNLIELVTYQGHSSVRIWGCEAVLDAIRKHLLNDTIWPDFTVLPSLESPVLSFHPLEPGKPERIAGLNVIGYPVNHAAAAFGFIIWEDDPAHNVVFTGDTGVNADDWWDFLNNLAFRVRNYITESSFPNEMHKLATVSRHLTPAQLRQELDRLDNPPMIYISHVKSTFASQVQTQLVEALKGLPYHLLREGDLLEF